MNTVTRQEINQHLQESFQALKLNPNATVEQWDALGMEYFNVGAMLNALKCFEQADAVRLVCVREAVPA